MAFDSSLRDSQRTRDQLSQEDDKFQIIKQWSEKLVLQELTTRIKTGEIGNDFITSHPTNGLMILAGGGTAVDDNLMLLPGETGGVPDNVVAVINPFNRFIDYLRDTNYVGTASTATINTTNNTIDF